MKIRASFLSLVFATLVASKSLPFFGSNQLIFNGDDPLKVPGENPLKFCMLTDDPILSIYHINLSPNPPVPGKKLSIEAKGRFTSPVNAGAYVNVSVKYGLITLIRQSVDLCEQLKNVDEECPLDGEKVIKKDVNLPLTIPPGTYTVHADVYSKDAEQITCLEAQVKF